MPAAFAPAGVARHTFSMLSGNTVNALLSIPVGGGEVAAGILAFADVGWFDG